MILDRFFKQYYLEQEKEMTTKEIAMQTIDKLPNEAVYDDILHALYINAKFEHGVKEIQEGKGIPHEEAKERLSKWVK
jgi:predicted transcriptional regulator